MMVASLLPDVVDEAASTAYSESFSVTTGAEETSTTEALTYDHYYGDTRNLSATSPDVDDNPTIMAYDEDTKEVTVAGLQASETRLLTIGYYKEAHQQYTGFSGFLRLIPFLAIIGLVITALWGLFSHFKRE